MIENASSMDRPVATGGPWTRKRRAMLLILAAVVVAIVLIIPSVLRWSRADRAVDASMLRTARVTRGDLQRDVSVQGRVVASLHPTLFSVASGVISLRTKEGSVVKKGDVLASIESAELRSELDQARSTLLSMQSELARQSLTSRQTQLRTNQASRLASVRLEAAKRSLDRAKRTFTEGITGKSDYERAEDDVRVATLEYEQARREIGLGYESLAFELKDRQLRVQRQAAETAELQRKFDELTIRSPFDGMVANIAVSDRDAVAPSQPILSVVNLSSLELEVSIPEDYATGAAIGTPAVISFGGRDYSGRITAISPEVSGNQVNGTVAFIDTAPTGLKQNQRVTTRIIFESKKNVLKVPRGPFVESGGGRHAYVVQDGIASRRPMDMGVVSVAEVEILSGLKEGETIVVSDTTSFENANSVMLR